MENEMSIDVLKTIFDEISQNINNNQIVQDSLKELINYFNMKNNKDNNNLIL